MVFSTYISIQHTRKLGGMYISYGKSKPSNQVGEQFVNTLIITG